MGPGSAGLDLATLACCEATCRQLMTNERKIMKTQTTRLFLAGLVLIVLVALSGTIGRDLWTPDEPRVTAICMEMAQEGDWVIPRLAGQPFVEKPPLAFVVGAGMIQVFGKLLSPIAGVRLSSVIWGFGVLAFTGLFVRRLFGDVGLAWKTVLILGSSWGFIEAQHWIRVDSALAFFVIAAVWAFSEAFIGHQPWWAVLGGAFTAGAFLSKGPIGPIMVFPAWLGLVLAYGLPAFAQRKFCGRLVISHLLGAIVFSVLSASWVVLLWSRGGPELFRHWFWDNQIGRASGSSFVLGHIHEGEPWFYLGNLVYLMIPWSPFVVQWLWSRLRQILTRRQISQASIFTLIWGLGSLLILSIPASKRGIYLLPALPGFAMMAAMGWKEAGQLWKTIYLNFLQVIFGSFLVALALLPLWAGAISEYLKPAAVELVSQWGLPHLLVLGIFCITVALVVSKTPTQFDKAFGVTALMMLAIWVFPARVVDLQKGLRGSVEGFVRSIPPDVWSQVKGWNLSQTMRGSLYVYEGLKILNCSDPHEAKAILEGRDPHYRYLVLTSRSDTRPLDGLKWELVTEGEKSGRRLRLITGAHPTLAEFGKNDRVPETAVGR